MAYRSRVGDRDLRIDVVPEADGHLAVELSGVPEGEADPARQPGGAGEGAQRRRVHRLEAGRAGGGWILARFEDGRSVEAFVESRGGVTAVWLDGVAYEVQLVDERAAPRRAGPGTGGGSKTLTAPMPGKVVRHLVSVGEPVAAGQGVIVVEAMKMENELRAPAAGVVKAIPAAEGTTVEAGATLVVLE